MIKEIVQGKGIPKEPESDDEAGLRVESPGSAQNINFDELVPSPGQLVTRSIAPINEDVTLSDLKRYAKKSRQKILVNIYPDEINVDITRLEE